MICDEDPLRRRPRKTTALEFISGPIPILPKDHYAAAPKRPGEEGKIKRDYGALTPVCTGPYKITGMIPGESVTMVRNDWIWDVSMDKAEDLTKMGWMSSGESRIKFHSGHNRKFAQKQESAQYMMLSLKFYTI
jgi:ABC-type oligopeptide transport system substrate-binding subunit